MRKKYIVIYGYQDLDYEDVVMSKKYLLPYILPYTECRKEEDKKIMNMCLHLFILTYNFKTI